METEPFNFLFLPSVVQELIADEIVWNLEPKTRLEFSLASKSCHSLFLRAKPPKMYKKVRIQSFRGVDEFVVTADSESLTLSLEKLTETFKNAEILHSVIFEGIRQPWKNLLGFGKCIKFVKKLELHVCEYDEDLLQLLRQLENCSDFSANNLKPDSGPEWAFKFVKFLPKHAELCFIGSVDDRILEILAEKTNKNNKIDCFLAFGRNRFSLAAIEHFLLNATFEKESRVVFHETVASRSETEAMFSKFCRRQVEKKNDIWPVHLNGCLIEVMINRFAQLS